MIIPVCSITISTVYTSHDPPRTAPFDFHHLPQLYTAHYDIKIWNVDKSAFPADLRVLINGTAPLLPDEAVAFAVCTAQSIATPSTAQSTATNSLVLDVLTFVILPGIRAPMTNCRMDVRTSMVFGVRRITGSPQILDDGHSSRAVTLAVTDYVRAETKLSTIQCVFDLSTARWTRTPVPPAKTIMQSYGLCCDVNTAGLRRLKVESVVLNSDHHLGCSDSHQAAQTRFSLSSFYWPPSSCIHRLFCSICFAIEKPKTSHTMLAETAESAPAPMHYTQLFQQYPQYMGGPATPSSFPSPFAPPHMYTMPAYPLFPSPFPAYGVYAPGLYNSQGEYILSPPSTDPQASPSSPTWPALSSSAASTIPVQDSAFNRSASDPCSYPIINDTILLLAASSRQLCSSCFELFQRIGINSGRKHEPLV
ncbi:hypothetical protein B0H19DRAFT_1060114 [Mycena capillaripes]|nr:hypothetical protein B0H19DRAFT_1060114 [Mycena capillaripes]